MSEEKTKLVVLLKINFMAFVRNDDSDDGKEPETFHGAITMRELPEPLRMELVSACAKVYEEDTGDSVGIAEEYREEEHPIKIWNFVEDKYDLRIVTEIEDFSPYIRQDSSSQMVYAVAIASGIKPIEAAALVRGFNE